MAKKKLHWTKTPKGKKLWKALQLKGSRNSAKSLKRRKGHVETTQALPGDKPNGKRKRGRPKGSKHLAHPATTRKGRPEKDHEDQLIEERQVGILFGETWKTIEYRARSSRVPVAVLAGRLGRLLLGAASGQVLGA